MTTTQAPLDFTRLESRRDASTTRGTRVPPGNRAAQILEAFETFHAANPHVWQLFEQFALETIFAGHKHFSADSICHRIRWEADVVTRGSTLKINDHFTAYYARLFHAAHPEYAGFFRNRVLPSKQQPACEPDRQVFVGQHESKTPL